MERNRKIMAGILVAAFITALALSGSAAADTKIRAVSIMSVTPIQGEVQPGGTATYDVEVRSISMPGDPMENVTLAVEDPKPGWTYSFDPEEFPINATETKHSTLSIGVYGDAELGEYKHKINASAYAEGYGDLWKTSETAWTGVKTVAILTCLGDCCSDENCTILYEENETCKECIDMGKYWKPNKDVACFDDKAPSDLCLNWCPHCCDGEDNDFDGKIDFPADLQCTCGLDPLETEPLPPIPEAPGIILLSIGLLALILLVRGRRKE